MFPSVRTSDLRRIVEAIQQRYRPQRIVLFGSSAWGDPTQAHDFDLIVVKATRASHAKRAEQVYKIIGSVARTSPVDILVYTPRELQERMGMGDPFIRRIVADGKILYDAAA